MSKLNNNKIVVWRLVLATMVLSHSAVAAVDTTSNNLLNTTLKKYYPVFNQANQCQGVIANSGASDGVTNEPYKIGYCVKIDAQKLVDTPAGKRLYLVTTGKVAFDEKGERFEGGRVFSGLVGMFVLKPQGSEWMVESANPYMNAGSSGQGLTDWTLHKFSPNVWGFLNQHGDTHFGVSGTDFVILVPKGKSIQQSWIGSSLTNEGAVDCEDKKNFAVCSQMSAEIKIDNSKITNGFYPLIMTVDGHDGKKVYKNKRFIINYLPSKGYIEPKDYPLKDLDY